MSNCNEYQKKLSLQKKKKMKSLSLLVTLSMFSFFSNAQINPNYLGAWYMYFVNGQFGESAWGMQGDIQYRSWNAGDDLEQLLIRGGVTYSPKNAKIKFTLGYGDITSGLYGVNQRATKRESRIYQEALYPTKIGKRFFLNHRIRFEQRFVENQSFRTRYRFNLFMNVALNSTKMKKNTVYLAFYNEIFINGQRNIGNGQTVSVFDRNRFYAAVGFMALDKLKIQLGIMNQTTNGWKKNQLQLSVHHKI